MNLAIMFLALFILLVLYVPIAFAVAFASLIFIGLEGMPLFMVAQRMYSGSDSFVLLALPLFVMTGLLMNVGGISDKLIALARAMVGHIRGGLGIVNVVVSMFFAGVSGSAVADTAAVGSVLIPAMEKQGYPKDYAAAVTAASSTIGIIIPPSIPMVLYGVIAGTSVGTLFIAGIVPGLMVALGQMLVAYWIAVKKGYPVANKFSLHILFKSFLSAAPALALPIIIIGGISFGVFTPTEAGAVAVVYALIVGVAYRSLSLKNVYKALVDSAILSAIVMIIVSTSTLLGWVLSYNRIPHLITEVFLNLPGSTNFILTILAALLIFLGTFLHGTPLQIIVVPMLLPLIQALGVNMIHFGMIVVLCVGIGQQTPPVGSALYVTAAISDLDILDIVKASWPFILIIILTLLLVIYFPILSTFLPSILR